MWHIFNEHFVLLHNKNLINIMTIERGNNELILRLPLVLSFETIQRTIDLLSLKEANALSMATQTSIDTLVKEINSGWWEKNRNSFIQ